MGNLRDNLIFSSKQKYNQAKAAVLALHEIEKCPECKAALAGIEFHAKMGHPQVK